MPFVVKVIGTGFGVMWLAPAPAAASYSFGSRKDAINFPTQADAQDAVDKTSKAVGAVGMVFSVVVAD
jgi:hypothetical protein